MIYIESGDVYDTHRPTVAYDNILSDGVLSGDAASGFPVQNAISGSTWDYWQAPSAASASLQVVLTSAQYADCLFIDAHDMQSEGADFRLQRSTDSGTTWLDVVGWKTPTDNKPIMVLFPRAQGDAWRIQQRNGPANIGVIILGKKLAFNGGIDSRVTTFTHGERVELFGGNSLGGQFLGQKVQRKGGNTSLSFPWLPNDWAAGNMRDFEAHYNAGKPFGMALNPQFDREELAYCWRPDRAGELRPTFLAGSNGIDMTMQVDFYVGS